MSNNTNIATAITRLAFKYEDWSQSLSIMIASEHDSDEYKQAEVMHKFAASVIRQCIDELAEEGIEIDSFSYVQ